jgi:hypothetical protein
MPHRKVVNMKNRSLFLPAVALLGLALSGSQDDAAPSPDTIPKPTPIVEALPDNDVGGSPGSPEVGGRTSPDGKSQLGMDLPESERKKNVGGRDGAGLCVFTSVEYLARFQNVTQLFDFQQKMRQERGGGYPEKLAAMIKKYGGTDVQFVQDTSGDPQILLEILKSGRGAGVTYNGHDPHYRQSIAHMVCLVCFDGQWACISDNNFTKADQFVWMSPKEFEKRWKGMGGGWLVCLLSPPPPPVPHN